MLPFGRSWLDQAQNELDVDFNSVVPWDWRRVDRTSTSETQHVWWWCRRESGSAVVAVRSATWGFRCVRLSSEQLNLAGGGSCHSASLRWGSRSILSHVFTTFHSTKLSIFLSSVIQLECISVSVPLHVQFIPQMLTVDVGRQLFAVTFLVAPSMRFLGSKMAEVSESPSSGNSPVLRFTQDCVNVMRFVWFRWICLLHTRYKIHPVDSQSIVQVEWRQGWWNVSVLCVKWHAICPRQCPTSSWL